MSDNPRRRLRSIPKIRTFLRTNETPVCFVGPTACSLRHPEVQEFIGRRGDTANVPHVHRQHPVAGRRLAGPRRRASTPVSYLTPSSC
jgi:hypothetical protein